MSHREELRTAVVSRPPPYRECWPVMVSLHFAGDSRMCSRAMVSQLWVGTHDSVVAQFLAGHGIEKLRADKESVLSTMETERINMCSLHMSR